MTDTEFNTLKREYARIKNQYEYAEQLRFNEKCQADGFHSTVCYTPEDDRFIITIDRYRNYNFFKVHLGDEGWGNTSISYWAYPEDFSEGKLHQLMTKVKADTWTGYLYFKRWMTGHEFAVGDIVAWNDPAIDEYDEDDRRIACNRRFVIRSIDYDADRAFITTEFTEAEVPINELVMLEIYPDGQ